MLDLKKLSSCKSFERLLKASCTRDLGNKRQNCYQILLESRLWQLIKGTCGNSSARQPWFEIVEVVNMGRS